MTGEVLEWAEGALSQREVEVLEMASQGLTNTEIASRMHVTVHTVKFHLAATYRKLGVANRTEAAVVYLRGAADALPPVIQADTPS